MSPALVAISALLLAAAPADDAFRSVRQRLQRGNYAEARAVYEALLPDPRAAVGLSRAHQAEGANRPKDWPPSTTP